MHYGLTDIVVCRDGRELGAVAAAAVARCLRLLLGERDTVTVIFAAGESQGTFLDALAAEPAVDWGRIDCFNMDDFYDPDMPEEFTCGHQTKVRLYDRVSPRSSHLVRWNARDPEAEAARFADEMRRFPKPAVLCQGIGTSGHLALNEPGDTDFDDPRHVRVAGIAEQSKRQLMTDPNFRGYGSIPARGITMTIPAMLAAEHVFTMTPYAIKREIVARLLATPDPTPDLPASILSTVPGTLFLDRDSCPLTDM